MFGPHGVSSENPTQEKPVELPLAHLKAQIFGTVGLSISDVPNLSYLLRVIDK